MGRMRKSRGHPYRKGLGTKLHAACCCYSASDEKLGGTLGLLTEPLNMFVCLVLQQPGHTLCASRDRDALTKIGAVSKQDQGSGS